VRRAGFEPPTARSVAWCSASIWSDLVGSGLLTSEASSIWTDPVGSCRIVWMIKRMIKPCDAASSATRPRRPLWGRHQIFRLVPAGGLACGTAAVPSSVQRITRQLVTVHRVLARTILAAHVGWVVQPVRPCRPEWRQVE
jgi:hypothetical protein